MGGQACVLYGAAEFSRDADLAIVADAQNLTRLQQALDELLAKCIALPPFEARYLEMGLAVRFRCRHPEASGLRIDVMSRMRGVDSFAALWDRRTTLELGDEIIDVMSLPDLVQAKKTQRLKDWPMIARLVEANYFQHLERPSPEHVAFWLKELRSAGPLMDIARRFSDECADAIGSRALLASVLDGDLAAVEVALAAEEQREREADRAYWLPLKRELERLRHSRTEE